MSDSVSITLTIVLSYIAGSTPFGLIVAKLVAGIDIRATGSGNIGATNVGRTLGAKWGITVLILDAIKGLLPALLLPMWLASRESNNSQLLGVCAGVATIVGHMAPFWLKFRGGKGVATSLGVVIILAPWGSLAGLGVFLVLAFATRIVALASMLGAVAFGVCQVVFVMDEPFRPPNLPLALFALAIPLLIIVRHWSNIGRMIRGQEKRFSFGSSTQSEGSAENPDGASVNEQQP